MIVKLIRFFCIHDYKYLRKLNGVERAIWKCNKCGQRVLQAYRLGVTVKIKDNEYLGLEEIE